MGNALGLRVKKCKWLFFYQILSKNSQFSLNSLFIFDYALSMKKELSEIQRLLRVILCKNEFIYILAVIYFLLMTWPFVVIENMDFPKAIVIYIFSVWFSLIAILFFRSRILEE